MYLRSPSSSGCLPVMETVAELEQPGEVQPAHDQHTATFRFTSSFS